MSLRLNCPCFGSSERQAHRRVRPERFADREPDFDALAPSVPARVSQVLRRARILFQKEQPCYACHMVHIRKTVYRQAVEVGGFTGPHLIDAGLRLRPDFIVALLKSPDRYAPNGRMPRYGDKAFTPLSEQDLITLAAYIATLK